MYKACSRCKRSLSLDQFNKNSRMKDGKSCYCISCTKIINKEIHNRYYSKPNNRQKVLEKVKKRSSRPEQKLKRKEYLREYESRPEKAAMIKQKRHEYYEQNKERFKAYHCLRERNKRTNDPLYRLHLSVSSNVRQALKGSKSGRSWETLVGYTVFELRQHLESLFTPGMTWENYGRRGWVIDHIRPQSSFLIDSAECQAFKECWALSNLRPLWEIENMRKGNKLLSDFE